MMLPRLLVLLLFMVSLMMSGCAGSLAQPVSAALGGDCHNKTVPQLLDATDLKALFRDMAKELCVERCADCPDGTAEKCCGQAAGDRRATVMVTDFADLQTFLPSHSGFLMGELMRGGLNEICCYSIVQAEFAKYFKLSENGLVVLTRRAVEIKNNEYLQPEAIVGTYSYLNNNKVLVFVRKIDTGSGIISNMVTRELTYSCGGKSVLGYSMK